MNVLKKLWLAIENVASALNCFAATVDRVNAEIRLRAGIPDESGPALLPEANGAAGPAALPSGQKRIRSVNKGKPA